MLQSSLIGHIGQDAQIHQSNGGKPYVQVSVAVNRKRGEQEETFWVTIFSYQTNLQQYLTQGTKVYVSGDLRPRVYQSRTSGQWQAGLSIQANTIQLLGSPRTEQAATPPPPVPPATAQPAPTPAATTGVEDDGLPF